MVIFTDHILRNCKFLIPKCVDDKPMQESSPNFYRKNRTSLATEIFFQNFIIFSRTRVIMILYVVIDLKHPVNDNSAVFFDFVNF